MPSRIIRWEINASRSLSRVSMEAELTFDRMITAADDYGRLDARPEMLKAALFPVRASATPKRIMEWISELTREGCVRLYAADGGQYLAMTGWEKHRGRGRRCGESKYPAPPETQRGASEKIPEIPCNPREGNGGEGNWSLGSGATAPAKKRGRARQPQTLCPENLTDAQWSDIYAWRDKKRPQLSNAELSAQWDLHAYHFISEGKLRADWVRSFYKWLVNPLFKPATASGQKPTGQAYKPYEHVDPPPAEDPAEIEKAIAESRQIRSQGGLRRVGHVL